MSSNDTYGRLGIFLHWVTAALILTLWPLGKLMEDGPDWLYTLHIWLGLLVCGLTLVRVWWHFTQPKPEKLEMPRWEQVLFVANHYGLYIVLLLSSFSGIGILLAVGGLPPFTDFDIETAGDSQPGEFHETPANLMMLLLIMHVAGVLYYQFTKGKTLKRMGVKIKK